MFYEERQVTRKLIERHISLILSIAVMSMVTVGAAPGGTFEAPGQGGGIGEGYTATGDSKGIDAGFRAFTTPDILGICEKSAKPARLVAPRVPPVLHVYESFPFDRLKVIAVDASGKSLPPVPIEISIDNASLFVMTSDVRASAGNWVVPIHPGDFHFRVYTACPNTTMLSVEIPAVIRQRREAFVNKIAESYTSPEASRGPTGIPVRFLKTAFHMFTPSSLEEACENAPLPDKLVPREKQITVYENTAFQIGGSMVKAVDASGNMLPPVPIKIEADDTCCLMTTPDVLARAGNWVIPIHVGSFHLRVSTMCPNRPRVSVEIPVEVRKFGTWPLGPN